MTTQCEFTRTTDRGERIAGTPPEKGGSASEWNDPAVVQVYRCPSTQTTTFTYGGVTVVSCLHHRAYFADKHGVRATDKQL
jgi:hypothetical protein